MKEDNGTVAFSSRQHPSVLHRHYSSLEEGVRWIDIEISIDRVDVASLP
jgi:hypothetical protein